MRIIDNVAKPDGRAIQLAGSSTNGPQFKIPMHLLLDNGHIFGLLENLNKCP